MSGIGATGGESQVDLRALRRRQLEDIQRSQRRQATQKLPEAQNVAPATGAPGASDARTGSLAGDRPVRASQTSELALGAGRPASRVGPAADRVRQETGKSPRAGAAALREEVEGLKPKERQAFLEELRPEIRTISQGANGTPSEEDRLGILTDLTGAAEASGKGGARTIASEFVEVADNQHTDVDDTDQLGGAIKQVIKNGEGASLATALVAETQGDPELEEFNENVTKGTREGMRDLREDFEGASEKYQVAEARLNRFIEGFGPGMSEGQIETAIEAFKSRPENQTIYEKFEETSTAYAKTLKGAGLAVNTEAPDDLRQEAERALGHVPLLAHSKAGQEMIVQGMEEQGATGGSFLDDAKTVAKQGKNAKKVLDQLAQVQVNAITREAIDLAADGHIEDARGLLSGLASQEDLLGAGVDSKKVASAVDDLMLLATEPNKQDEVLKSLKAKTKTAFGGSPNSRGAVAFGALGVVFAAVGAGQRLGHFGDLKLDQQIRTAIDTLGVPVAGVQLATGAISSATDGASAAKLSKVFGKGATALGILGGATQGIFAAKSLFEGNTREGLTGLANSAGSILLSLPSPHAKIAGALVLAGTAAVGAILGKKDPLEERYEQQATDQEDLRVFLEAGGYPPEAAAAFSENGGVGLDHNTGEFVVQVAEFFGKKPAEVLDYLKRHPDKIETFHSTSYGLQSKDSGNATTFEPIQQRAHVREYEESFDLPDRQDYEVDRHGRVTNAREVAKRFRVGDGPSGFASLLDGAADLRASGAVPKDWEVRVPERHREAFHGG